MINGANVEAYRRDARQELGQDPGVGLDVLS